MENNTWEGSYERLDEFWEYLSRESSLDYIPGFTNWWDYLHNNINHNIATGEAARRYYTTKEFSVIGVPTVFSPPLPQLDIRFFDSQNTWYRFDSGPLKRSLERFAKFPISTTFDQNIFHSKEYVRGYAQKCKQLIFIYSIWVCCLILMKIRVS